MTGRLALISSVLAAMAVASTPASAGSGAFAGNETLSGGGASVAVGDFNADGRTDIAQLHYTGEYVTPRFGTATGGFSPGATVPVGKNPGMVVVADFDADGDDDFAVNSSTDGKVNVRLSAGNGTFTNAADIDLAKPPLTLAVGDFNADGKEDLAIGTNNAGGPALAVRLGAGNGTFTAAPDVNVGAGALTVGDYNEDGLEDIAYGALGNNPSKVLLGTGGGAFTIGAAISLPDPANSQRAWATGDFNGDGNLDVAAAGGKDVVSVRLGKGDGTFPSGPDVPVGDHPYSPAVGDLDGDGNEDLVATNTDDDSVSVRLGNGDGSFRQTSEVKVGDNPVEVALTDLDGDGNEDLAAANYTDANVSLKRGLGTPPLAGNLLVNGGFEGTTAAKVTTQSPAIPGWERTNGVTYARYGLPSHAFFPSLLDSPRYRTGGGSFLWGGGSATTGTGEVSQTVDVSGSAPTIDAGITTANLSAHLGGAGGDSDRMDARATFLDAAGATLGSLAIGPVTAADRKKLTILLRRAGSAPVPAGTRRIRVTLTATSEIKVFSTATADNVKLTLDAPPVPPGGGGTPDPGPGGPGPTRTDRLAPVIGKVTLKPAAFSVARRRPGKSRGGTTIRFSLSERATVALQFHRAKGRRYVKAGKVRLTGRAGANHVAFTGAIGRKALRAGNYRLVVVAVDAAGNRATSKPRAFRVLK